MDRICLNKKCEKALKLRNTSWGFMGIARAIPKENFEEMRKLGAEIPRDFLLDFLNKEYDCDSAKQICNEIKPQ